MVDNTTEPTPIENNPPVPTPPQEETPKITREVKTEKVKDSRREESGKRLAELTRQARERKKLEQQQQAEESSFGFLPFYVIPISLAGVVGYWF